MQTDFRTTLCPSSFPNIAKGEAHFFAIVVEGLVGFVESEMPGAVVEEEGEVVSGGFEGEGGSIEGEDREVGGEVLQYALVVEEFENGKEVYGV